MDITSASVEEWVNASAGIQAAVVDTVWTDGIDRVIPGASDLRCKLQLTGCAHYSTGDGFELVGPGHDLNFLYKPEGAVKHEHIDAGTAEKSITFAFPVLYDSFGGYGREDPLVDQVMGAMAGQVISRRVRMPSSAWGIAASILALDRHARGFDRIRRARIDELACIALDVFLDSFQHERLADLTARERRQISEARDLLVANLGNPPPLNMLAAMVGTNRTKLNRGFNAMFGMPAYQYLLNARMTTAHALLCEGRMIGQVAEACGYEHVSNFTNAFKAFHGVTPSVVRSH
ncbi:MAG: hypothetical protein BVN33_07690 [Proteobacteria bacterium ST_bin13]|jgi:AraC-like DNA-binding protein|nr:MAG: hypothetical protein BVN33_07690 [Proteobacteria bacterium ST_bin13]